VTEKVEALEVRSDQRTRSISRLVRGKRDHVVIEKHGQSNLADDPRSSTDAPAKAVLKAPVSDCADRLAGEVCRLAKRKPFPPVVRDKGETGLRFGSPHGSTLPSSVANGWSTKSPSNRYSQCPRRSFKRLRRPVIFGFRSLHARPDLPCAPCFERGRAWCFRARMVFRAG